MPIHDWTRADAGTFHDFHQDWTIEIRRALNAGVLPDDYVAVVAPLEPLPNEPMIQQCRYARKANRLAIRHKLGRVVAIIKVVSPGNKENAHAIRSFTHKAVDFLRNGIHFLMIDLFPPSKRDRHGLHHLIWDELTDKPFELPHADQPLAVATYDAGEELCAYVEPLAVGDRLPDMALYLAPGMWVPTPLEATYERSWAALPAFIQELVTADATHGR